MRDDETGESMEPIEEVPLVGLGESELERLVRGSTEGSRELIPETRGSILKINPIKDDTVAEN